MNDIPEHIKTYIVIALALAFIGMSASAIITWTIQSPAATRGLLLLPAVLLAILAQQTLPGLFRRARREHTDYRRQQRQLANPKQAAPPQQ